MTYSIEHKTAFTILGFGRTVQYGEGADKFAQITRQKQALWEAVTADGRLKQLTDMAPDSHLFAVNEAYQNEMWYYAGVASDAEAPANARAISFPESQYLVVTGSAATAGQLFGMLEGEAFGKALGEIGDYAYVGGPNAAVVLSDVDGDVTGEMWIPVQKH
ncbi:GyrI-like domain-containing protein [Lacticaseibacillus porcinae]|uniref:GyrI-like domain-containing protein n=1 Tax=Lacticaseibacillus porcinae TaxID=1123687 RepID=UPI000F79B598|nr:GyrI-like domain-containing protein [Lacticaseibacillus porcinae]